MNAYRFCVAPMMEWTDRHRRVFHRVVTRQARLHTEMVTGGAVLRVAGRVFLGWGPAAHGQDRREREASEEEDEERAPRQSTPPLMLVIPALLLLGGYLARRPERPWLWVPTGLLIGGAVGNLVDRLAHGAVTDFIKLPLWPAFNLADTAITVGVLALLWVLEGPRERAR